MDYEGKKIKGFCLWVHTVLYVSIRIKFSEIWRFFKLFFKFDYRIKSGGSIGGADLDIVDIIGSHVRFQVVKKKEMLWGKWGKDGRILPEGTVGKVRTRLWLLSILKTAHEYNCR